MAVLDKASPKITAHLGGSGGPTYACRGAVIGSNEKGSFKLEGFPHSGWSGIGNIETIVRVVDS